MLLVVKMNALLDYGSSSSSDTDEENAEEK